MKIRFDNTMQNKSKYNQTLPGLLKQTNLTSAWISLMCPQDITTFVKILSGVNGLLLILF